MIVAYYLYMSWYLAVVARLCGGSPVQIRHCRATVTVRMPIHEEIKLLFAEKREIRKRKDSFPFL
jgi:hypothetical protein